MALRLLQHRQSGATVDSGFYAACAGLRAQSQALEVVAHNLANLSTVGFRGEQSTFQSLVAVSHPTLPNVLNLATNNYGAMEGAHMDTSAGNLQTTGNPLDVGIEGQGYFVIQTPRGTRYTRNGSFQVSSTGILVTATGDPVYGDPSLKPKGLINVPPGAVSIASDGTISVRDVRLGAVSILHGGFSVQVVAEYGVSQPNSLSNGTTEVVPKTDLQAKDASAKRMEVGEGATIDQLVSGLQHMGATARDVISILQAIKSAGALDADLELI